jgi:periplasmic divalent cation tolerance protein
MTDARLVFLTAPSEEVADTLARALIGERLAACVHRLPVGRSLFRWRGALCDDPEVTLVVKTTASRVPALFARVKALHPYEVPEILAIAVSEGAEPYLAWLAAETATPPEPSEEGR